jgi:hypothetical protein
MSRQYVDLQDVHAGRQAANLDVQAQAVTCEPVRCDGDASAQALTRAAKAIEQDRQPEPPPWPPWVLPFDHAKLTRPADALAAFTESLSAAQPASKQQAVVMLAVATAACQDCAAGQ